MCLDGRAVTTAHQRDSDQLEMSQLGHHAHIPHKLPQLCQELLDITPFPNSLSYPFLDKLFTMAYQWTAYIL